MNGWVYNFLRKTQKYTGTDNVYLAEGGFWQDKTYYKRTIKKVQIFLYFTKVQNLALKIAYRTGIILN